MSNNKAILFLRGTRDKITDENKNTQLLPGLPLYNVTDNYLTIGSFDISKLDDDEPFKSINGNVVVSPLIKGRFSDVGSLIETAPTINNTKDTKYNYGIYPTGASDKTITIKSPDGIKVTNIDGDVSTIKTGSDGHLEFSVLITRHGGGSNAYELAISVEDTLNKFNLYGLKRHGKSLNKITDKIPASVVEHSYVISYDGYGSKKGDGTYDMTGGPSHLLAFNSLGIYHQMSSTTEKDNNGKILWNKFKKLLDDSVLTISEQGSKSSGNGNIEGESTGIFTNYWIKLMPLYVRSDVSFTDRGSSESSDNDGPYIGSTIENGMTYSIPHASQGLRLSYLDAGDGKSGGARGDSVAFLISPNAKLYTMFLNSNGGYTTVENINDRGGQTIKGDLTINGNIINNKGGGWEYTAKNTVIYKKSPVPVPNNSIYYPTVYYELNTDESENISIGMYRDSAGKPSLQYVCHNKDDNGKYTHTPIFLVLKVNGQDKKLGKVISDAFSVTHLLSNRSGIDIYNTNINNLESINYSSKSNPDEDCTVTFYNGAPDTYGTVKAGKFIAVSDKRLKENITPYTANNKSILDLPIYKYNFISDENKKEHIGCLAQDLQEICPEIVDEGNDGYLAINESKIVYLLLEEVKKLKNRVDELEVKRGN